MKLKVGDVVAIRHYSTINPFISCILDMNSENIIIKLTKDFAINNLLVGDPVVIGCELDTEVLLIGCEIITISIDGGTCILKIDKDDIFQNERRQQRFPISLYADVLTTDSRAKHVVIIKDLSQYGMLIYSKTDFELNQFIEINVYTEKDVVFIKGCIVRKEAGLNYKKYGLFIKYENMKSVNLIERYLKKLKISYEQQIRKTKIED